VAKANLGTKRVCPETGRKFYDLEKDPIVSPYTQKEYPITFFEGEPEPVAPKPKAEEKPAEEVARTDDASEDEVLIDDDGPEIISLDDAEENTDDDDADEEIPDIPDIPDVDEDDDDASTDDETFLESDDENDDLSDVIVGVESNDDET